MNKKKSLEAKKQEALEKMAQPLPGIPEANVPRDWNGHPVEAAIGRPKKEYTPPIQAPPPGITGMPQAMSPLEPLEAVPDAPVQMTPEPPARSPEAPKYSTPGDCPSVVRPPRKPRQPRPVAKGEKPPRKKAQGRYGVYVGGRVTGASGNVIEVLVPELGFYRSHSEAQKRALEIATRKAGVVVEVHRLLDKFVLQGVTKVTLVKL